MSTPETSVARTEKSLSRIEEFRAKMATFERDRRELDSLRRGAIEGLLAERRVFVAEQQKALKEFVRANNAELRQLGYEPKEADGDEPTAAGVAAAVNNDPFAKLFPNPPKAAKSQTGTANPRYKNGSRVGKGGKSYADSDCPICLISGHDGRAHCNQEPRKPFTRSELIDRGFPTKEG